MPTFMGHVAGRRILLQVYVGPAGEVPLPTDPVTALVDTGATISGITPRLVKRLGLKSRGEWMKLGGVHGSEDVPSYKVALILPISENQKETYGKGNISLDVAEFALPDSIGFDVLLGMDFLHPFHLTLYKDNFILSN